MPDWMIWLFIIGLAVIVLTILGVAILAKRSDQQAQLDYEVLAAEEELERSRRVREASGFYKEIEGDRIRREILERERRKDPDRERRERDMRLGQAFTVYDPPVACVPTAVDPTPAPPASCTPSPAVDCGGGGGGGD